MKKTVLTAILLLVGVISFAQTFSFGPKAGLNISNYTGGNIKSQALVGYHLGGILSFGFGKNFALQPEVLFSTQGAQIDNDGQKTDFKINYVTVPVMLKFRTNGGFIITAGPQVGFLTSQDVPDQTIRNFAKNLDLSAGVGIGYQSNIGLGVEGRYIAGLSKVGNFSGQTIDPDFKNSVIQFSLFWAIPLGGN
ncbi:porin family protein [Cytophagaceae bacterium YF14B1]|uniref:Porin family protein n=1 Tax=Xanthocytophaga flava TaxID=3048013 RepID=A0AAE3QWY0_9BACT|nr:porin family protein [Xanthocytophaga flavus]MDJ1484750.1 porin family protein [Xanthocytophaga flavus]